jgi:RHS repeat-associated protein
MSQAKTIDQDNRSEQRAILLAVDLQNSVLTELDAGNLNSIAYSPYGQRSSKPEVMTSLGFNGELLERNVEYYLLGHGHRTYNPKLMRFQSPDNLSPFGKGGLNAYMYCGGEPVMNSDPTGQSIWAFSRFVQSTTGRVGNVAIQMVSKTASTVGSGVSQVLGATRSAAQTAQKLFTDNFLFDPDVMKNLGPPPTKIKPTPPTSRVINPGRYKNPYKSPYISREPSLPRSSRPTSQLRANGVSRLEVRRPSATGGPSSSPIQHIRSGN